MCRGHDLGYFVSSFRLLQGTAWPYIEQLGLLGDRVWGALYHGHGCRPRTSRLKGLTTASVLLELVRWGFEVWAPVCHRVYDGIRMADEGSVSGRHSSYRRP